MSDVSTKEIAASRNQALRREIWLLKELMASLSANDLARPSACSEWQVDDVAAHMVPRQEDFAKHLSQALKGEVPPVRARPQYTPEGSAHMAIDLRKTLGDQLVPTFIRGLDQVHQLLGQIGPEDWDKLISHPGDGVIPLHLYVNLLFTNIAIHGWDIRRGVDPNAALSPYCVPGLIANIERWLQTIRIHPTSRLPEPLRFRFQLTGPVTRSRDILVQGDAFRFEADAASQADVTFRCDAGDFVLMMYGRLSRDEAEAEGRLAIEGERYMADRLEQAFAQDVASSSHPGQHIQAFKGPK